jgi:hypothetical protein
MEDVEEFTDLCGEDKRHYVLTEMRDYIGYDLFVVYRNTIEIFIEMMVNISQGDIKIQLNKTKRKCGKYCCRFKKIK